jgi:large subunit ribosomal protein L19
MAMTQVKNRAPKNGTILKDFTNQYLRTDLPETRIGDLVKINTKVDAGSQKRAQSQTGVIIAQHKDQLNTTLTLRRVSKGFGMEFIFIVNSPKILSIEIIKRASVKRAKLYYLRERQGKKARLKPAKV